ASAVFADHVHTVVPVTGADEWEAVLPTSEALQNGSHAVLVDTRRFFRPARQIVIRVLVLIDRASLDERDGFIQDPTVPCAQHVAACRQGQPKVIIRTARTHPSA